jgi:hypothetical protein
MSIRSDWWRKARIPANPEEMWTVVKSIKRE